ncbi:hypothetical protein EJ03DRAFT_345981 [Teratosphaeria nubilosa]|uniref:DAGKc domain-containing protein n=1 Tax=Teratosphaeria nubilosa TaxID=161662 RepID=A0A6G1KY34_9PEZI|nr:hypothetical protein EJ03DRAFT_345981 [Teratosphaeria nubilosa]
MSSPFTSNGTVDGRQVSFTYQREDGGTSRALKWIDDSKAETAVEEADIIAALPVQPDSTDEYSVLYVVPNAAAQNDKGVSPVLLRSFFATGLPEQFLNDYEPSEPVYWSNNHNAGSDDRTSMHIVASTGSGTQQAASVWELVLKPLLDLLMSRQHVHYKLHYTSSEHTITDLTKELFLSEANSGVDQAIILLSGDGGMIDLVDGLTAAERSRNYVKPNVTLLPLGTGNALAHSSGITADNTMGLKTLLQGYSQELPVFRVTFSAGARSLANHGTKELRLREVAGTPVLHGAVVASWGLHSTLVADSDTPEYRKFGAERFQMAGKELLYPAEGSSAHAFRGRLSVLRPSMNTKDDWQAIERQTHGYVLATFCSQLEKGFTISPASKPLDGKLRLIHFRALGGDAAMGIMTAAYQGGKHVENPEVGYEEIEGLRIEFDEQDGRWRRVCIDGKIIRVEEGGWMEIRAGVKGVVNLIAR